MSEFGKLLRSSRVAQVARPLKGSKRHPTRQVLETREAALSRQEWGLKYALPSKIRSRYLTLTQLDSLERLVDFEANGGDHYRRLRFQELGLVPTTESDKNPLFYNASRAPAKSSKVQLDDAVVLTPDMHTSRVQAVMDQLRAMRPELKQHLMNKVPRELKDTLKSNSVSVGDQFESIAFQFLLQKVQENSTNHTSSVKRADHKIEGTGGLSYALKGRLRNSPNGFITKNIVPGRVLADESTAIGGFVAFTDGRSSQSRARSTNSEPREKPIPQFPVGATINKDGAVRISVDAPRADIGRQKSVDSLTIKPMANAMKKRGPARDNKIVFDMLDLIQNR